ncbi:MAG: hypothetical protein LBQ12_06785 [Deltaproteobacteria bacterium]|jgi:hypothetical protein|nr:hypothetical protein [Deltaproteobacteria bacterium]
MEENPVLTALLARVAKLENDHRELQFVILSRLVGQWLPDTNKILLEFREDIDSLKATVGSQASLSDAEAARPFKKHKKYFKNYVDYQRIMEMKEAGVSINKTSQVLGIPYSSVHAYTHLKADEVENLKRKHDAAERYNLDMVTRPPREREIPSPSDS